MGDADAGGGEPIERIDLDALPRFLLRLAAEARALADGACSWYSAACRKLRCVASL
jgi:hypothetical protein